MSPTEQILRQIGSEQVLRQLEKNLLVDPLAPFVEAPRKPATPEPWVPIYEVDVAKLSDGKLSVRVDGDEVALLPRKADCAEDDLLRAFLALARAVDEIVRDAVGHGPDKARAEILSEMSW